MLKVREARYIMTSRTLLPIGDAGCSYNSPKKENGSTANDQRTNRGRETAIMTIQMLEAQYGR